MFTGIIETLGEVRAINELGMNTNFWLQSSIAQELKIDQSLAHNGVCLTIVDVKDDTYLVTAVKETLHRTNLSALQISNKVNLERCMKLGDRLDGHLVQGHVDQTGIVKSIVEQGGSWVFEFEYDSALGNITVEKGSICVNGTSLTVVKSEVGLFSVAIIPYTYFHTVFQFLQKGERVNLEFDILGKYIAKLYSNNQLKQNKS